MICSVCYTKRAQNNFTPRKTTRKRTTRIAHTRTIFASVMANTRKSARRPSEKMILGRKRHTTGSSPAATLFSGQQKSVLLMLQWRRLCLRSRTLMTATTDKKNQSYSAKRNSVMHAKFLSWQVQGGLFKNSVEEEYGHSQNLHWGGRAKQVKIDCISCYWARQLIRASDKHSGSIRLLYILEYNSGL
jgi:hypothetical protein